MKIRSLSHAALTVSDFNKAVRWYSEMFGFALIAVQDFPKGKVDQLHDLYQLDNTAVKFGILRAPKGGMLEIFEFTNKAQFEQVHWNRPGFTHVALDVKNVRKWYETLRAKGVQFLSEPQSTDGTDWVFMKGFDGNLIELIDLKANYGIIRFLGGIAGKFMATGKFKQYYS